MIIPHMRKTQLIRVLVVSAVISVVVIYSVFQIDSVKIAGAKFRNNIHNKVNTFIDEKFRDADKLVPIKSLNDKSDKDSYLEKVDKPKDGGQKKDKRGLGTDSKVRAALIVVVNQRNELPSLLSTMTNYEERFNHKYKYDWVIVSYKSLLNDHKEELAAIASGTIKFFDLRYQSEFLTYRENTDRKKVRDGRAKLRLPKEFRKHNTIQARHFTRFQAGHFYNIDTIWNDYDYYWKIPSGSLLTCDVDYDVFEFMQTNQIKYGWLLMDKLPDQMHRNLLNHIKDYVQDKDNSYLPNSDEVSNSLEFVLHPETINELKQNQEDIFWQFASCAYNPEFELADARFFRSAQYMHLFNYLDNLNGVYYECWREAHFKTIATSLFLDSKQVHFFNDLAVQTYASNNCPTNLDFYIDKKCTCDPTKHNKQFAVTNRIKGTYQVMAQSDCVRDWHSSFHRPLPPSFQTSEEFESFFSIFNPEN